MGAYSTPPYPLTVRTSPKIFVDHFWKDNSNPVRRCQHLLQLCRFWGSIAVMLVVLSAIIMLMDLCCNYTGDCFCFNYAVRSFCSIGETFCSKYVGDNFYWIMHVGVSIAIMQVVFSAVDYAHVYIATTETVTSIITIEKVMYDYCYWIIQVTVSVVAIYVTVSRKFQLFSPIFNWYQFFIKLTCISPLL